MRHRLNALAVLLCTLAWSASAAAQSAQGVGQQATERFTLREGLAAWELEHQGEGEFVVRLLDAEGNLVEQLAQLTGAARVSKAARIPRTGEYLYDVAATGPWSIRLRPQPATEEASPTGVAEVADAPDAEWSAGREAGEAAARERSGGAWFGAGFLGGATLGPVGAGVALALAARGAEAPVDDPRLLDQRPRYVEGFREGYRARLLASRRGAAIIGGVAGTTVLTFLLIQFMGSDGGGPPPGGGNGGTTF